MFIVHLLYIACEDMTWSLSQHSGLVKIEQGRLSGVRLRRGLGGLCVCVRGGGGGFTGHGVGAVWPACGKERLRAAEHYMSGIIRELC